MVDPLAEDYYGISPYAYVANNPLKFIDPNGLKIIKPYEEFKQFTGLEQQLRSNLKNATTRTDKRLARKELRSNFANIRGYQNYQNVERLLTEFKQANESEYNLVDNLQFNGAEIDKIIEINGNYSGDESGQLGQTEYVYDNHSSTTVVEFLTGETRLIPTAIKDNKIVIILYSGIGGLTLRTLANEFGNAIFAVTNPDRSHNTSEEMPYHMKPSTKFSFDYEDYITKGKKKKRPNPQDY